MPFPLSVRGTVTIPGLSGVPPALLDDIAALVAGQGATVLARGVDRLVIKTAWFLGDAGTTPSALFFVDEGTITLEPSSSGTLIRYDLSTRRRALISLCIAAIPGLVVANLTSVPWGIAACLGMWLWWFGWKFVAQSMRAEALFLALKARKPTAARGTGAMPGSA